MAFTNYMGTRSLSFTLFLHGNFIIVVYCLQGVGGNTKTINSCPVHLLLGFVVRVTCLPELFVNKVVLAAKERRSLVIFGALMTLEFETTEA